MEFCLRAYCASETMVLCHRKCCVVCVHNDHVYNKIPFIRYHDFSIYHTSRLAGTSVALGTSDVAIILDKHHSIHLFKALDTSMPLTLKFTQTLVQNISLLKKIRVF